MMSDQQQFYSSLLCVLIAFAGCAPAGSEFTIADVPGMTQEYTEVLKTVHDADSARASQPQIEAIDKKYDSLRQKIQKQQLKIPKDRGMEIAKEQMAAMKLYDEELDRIRAIPDAAKELEDLIPLLTSSPATPP